VATDPEHARPAPGLELGEHEPLAVAATAALRAGDVDALQRLLAEHPDLARGRVESGGGRCGSRTLLHVFADWPGNRPNAREIVTLLHGAGADLDAAFIGAHAETALHWAASNDDVALIDALLDAGADLESPGSVIGGGAPLADATAFGQWRAAERLLQRGARATFFEAAVMGLTDRLEAELAATPGPGADELTHALWGACHGGRQAAAALLLERGADVNWVGWDDLTALDAADRSGASALVDWLRERGGRSASELA
jgi:plasmid stabilization system protein ParE